jgi:hypothetical protein
VALGRAFAFSDERFESVGVGVKSASGAVARSYFNSPWVKASVVSGHDERVDGENNCDKHRCYGNTL